MHVRDISVGNKLLVAITLSAGMALLVMCLVVSAGSLLRQQRQTRQQLMVLAEVIGQNSSAALTFGDAKTARETLTNLRANTLVATAAIYDRDDRLFVSLPLPNGDPEFPATWIRSADEAGDEDFLSIGYMMSGRTSLARPITLDTQSIGTMLLVANLRPVWYGWLTEVALLLTAAAAAFGSALLMALYMRRLIAGPLTELTKAVKAVTVHQDYSMRVALHSRDEIGLLGNHFNDMLSEIERRDSRLALHQEELEHSAHYDALTGVPNRRLLADRLGIAIARARRTGKSLAVCYLDLDGFKGVNDQFGHAGGDLLLIEITERLKAVLRADDTLSRLGGDEFVLLLSDLVQIEESHPILDRVLVAVGTPVLIEGTPASVSGSIGVTLFPADDVDADTLLRHADQAMYRAKEAGKNRYNLFDPDLDRRVQVHRTQLERLREALENDEFVLHYQPKVDLVTGDVIGAEALIRWQHPERGLLPPVDFLLYMNGSDLEIPVGEWVIDTVLKQIEAWHAIGLTTTASANITAAHLLHPGFSEHLQQALERHPNVAPENLELEILETAALADLDQAVKVVTSCRQLGVRFALDDFGTGYSSLTYFRSLPVDILKIDQSFVREMLDDPDDLGIVETVLQLARAFNRPVIAEGVETLDLGAVLINLGCRYAQGYGIARPMPAEKFPGWVDEWCNEAAWRNINSHPTSRQTLTLLVATQSYRNWIDNIDAHLAHPEDESLVIPDGHHCKFWHWYLGSGTVRYGEFPGFQAIAQLHEQAHLVVVEMILLARDGRGQAARERLPELHETRDSVVKLIEVLIEEVAAASAQPLQVV